MLAPVERVKLMLEELAERGKKGSKGTDRG
jgi:hypothetical protein